MVLLATGGSVQGHDATCLFAQESRVHSQAWDLLKEEEVCRRVPAVFLCPFEAGRKRRVPLSELLLQDCSGEKVRTDPLLGIDNAIRDLPGKDHQLDQGFIDLHLMASLLLIEVGGWIKYGGESRDRHIRHLHGWWPAQIQSPKPVVVINIPVSPHLKARDTLGAKYYLSYVRHAHKTKCLTRASWAGRASEEASRFRPRSTAMRVAIPSRICQCWNRPYSSIDNGGCCSRLEPVGQESRLGHSRGQTKTGTRYAVITHLHTSTRYCLCQQHLPGPLVSEKLERSGGRLGSRTRISQVFWLRCVGCSLGRLRL